MRCLPNEAIAIHTRPPRVVVPRLSAVRYLVVLLRLHVLVETRGLRRLEGHEERCGHRLAQCTLPGEKFNPRNEKLLYACLHIEDIEAAKTLIVGCRKRGGVVPLPRLWL